MNPPLLPLENAPPPIPTRNRQTLLSFDESHTPSQQKIPAAAREKCVALLQELLRAVVLPAKDRPEEGRTHE